MREAVIVEAQAVRLLLAGRAHRGAGVHIAGQGVIRAARLLTTLLYALEVRGG